MVGKPQVILNGIIKREEDGKMKRLIFGKGLMAPSIDGQKTFTVRLYRKDAHDFTKGDIIIGEFKDGVDILLQILEDTQKDTFKNLKRPKRSLGQKGYYFDNAYFEELKEYYPDLSWDMTGAVIRFEILRVNDIPVISINEHAPKGE